MGAEVSSGTNSAKMELELSNVQLFVEGEGKDKPLSEDDKIDMDVDVKGWERNRKPSRMKLFSEDFYCPLVGEVGPPPTEVVPPKLELELEEEGQIHLEGNKLSPDKASVDVVDDPKPEEKTSASFVPGLEEDEAPEQNQEQNQEGTFGGGGEEESAIKESPLTVVDETPVPSSAPATVPTQLDSPKPDSEEAASPQNRSLQKGQGQLQEIAGGGGGGDLADQLGKGDHPDLGKGGGDFDEEMLAVDLHPDPVANELTISVAVTDADPRTQVPVEPRIIDLFQIKAVSETGTNTSQPTFEETAVGNSEPMVVTVEEETGMSQHVTAESGVQTSQSLLEELVKSYGQQNLVKKENQVAKALKDSSTRQNQNQNAGVKRPRLEPDEENENGGSCSRKRSIYSTGIFYDYEGAEENISLEEAKAKAKSLMEDEENQDKENATPTSPYWTAKPLRGPGPRLGLSKKQPRKPLHPRTMMMAPAYQYQNQPKKMSRENDENDSE